jgi:hypothetical protein
MLGQCKASSVTRRLPRVRLNAAAAVTVLVFIMGGAHFRFPLCATAHDLRISSAERAGLMQRGCELADEIAVVGILSKSYLEHQDFIWTRYTARVEESLKGPTPNDSTLVFYQGGGTIGNRALFASDRYAFSVGESYLIFTVRCEGRLGPTLFSRPLIAQIQDTIAITHQPPATVETAALLDSVRSGLQVCSLAYQRTHSDLVLRGVVESKEKEHADWPHWYSGGLVGVSVSEVLNHSGGPLPTTGEIVPFSVRAVLGAGRPPSGSTPTLAEGEDVVVFLHQENGAWVLGNSVYAKWRLHESMAYVEAERQACYMQRAVVDSVPWVAMRAALTN